ncbi:MAG: type II secretion system F family protein [Deltaproteobacteria bacterium]|nr:type II secretion system F family protein [bacterium]MCB9477371.1 type II secretion system F family protein [Deltaproteobacteria bacterium]MCB9478993.1 type II secretion system F family protein [Deltaproteobacteria bacterium]MCB9487799.1 type II secretion system F family protein [Deltaproteobacteria bacterium]
MAIYKWEGRTRTGSVAKGEMEAPSEEAVIARLRSQQIVASKVKAKGRSSDLMSIDLMKQKVKEQDIVIFTRQFATMIDAGLPLVQCLEILVAQQVNKTFADALNDIKNDVEAGSTFAKALGKHPKIFDQLFVALVAAGEVGGILDTIMNRLGAYIEKASKLKKKVKGAMVYPAAVLGITFIVVLVLLIFVIPVFKSMFEDFGGQLPGPTQLIVNVSEAIRGYWFIIFPAMIGAVYAIKYALGTEKGRVVFDDFILKVPVFGILIRKVAVAKFTRTLGTMITSGVPILDGLDIVAKTSGNKTIERAILKTKGRIAEGKTIAEPLAESGVFPAMVCQMITVGESTGALDVMLAKIADFYEDEVDMAVNSLTTLIEPLMMVILGGTVGFLLVCMYLPIFKLVSVIG